jgi:hypothetical protein
MVKQSRLAVILTVVALLGLLFSDQTSATLISVERVNGYSTEFDDHLNTFAGAVLRINTVQKWQSDTAGDTASQAFPLAVGYQNVRWTGDADIGVSNVVLNPASASADITSLTGKIGFTCMTADVSASTGFPTVGVSGGRYFLQESFASPGGVGDGSPFIWQMSLPGDWSSVGTGYGQHELLAINPLWTITDNFVFDGRGTIFRAQMDEYFNDGRHNINIAFRLHGAPQVPIPPSVWLFGSGLVGLIGLRRFKRG